MKICPECNTKYQNGLFCTQCGSDLIEFNNSEQEVRNDLNSDNNNTSDSESFEQKFDEFDENDKENLGSKEDVKREYEELKNKYKNTSWDDFKKGDWFTNLIQWMLTNYSKKVDAEYIAKKYPGLTPEMKSKKIIKLASRYNAVSGGISATAITVAEAATVASAATSSLVTIPAIAVSLIGDVTFTTRTQLRSAYDLSVIYGIPGVFRGHLT